MSDVDIPGFLLKEIREALCSAFPNETKLAIMVQDQFGENLRNIAGGQDLNEVAFNLVKHFKAKGKLYALIKEACNTNGSNPRLKEVVANFYIITSLFEILEPLENNPCIKVKMQEAYKASFSENASPDWREDKTPNNLNNILKKNL